MQNLYNQLFQIPKNKIICAARNYKGNTQRPAYPIMFQKPLTSLVREGIPLKFSKWEQVVHEVELAVLIKKEGKDITEDKAMEYVGGYAIALDFMLFKEIKDAQQNGLPWDLPKGCDQFCPISDFISIDKVQNPHAIDLLLKINGEERQKGFTGDMHYGIPQLISYTSKFMSFTKGDLLLTGTPDGIGPVKAGDKLEISGSHKGAVLITAKFELVN